ncbi:hypothetical protein RHGRI_031315 [Rhododendron griersonianum]|uniref:Uncharacterized protein n=1 Tax=Rhododendron griersonianum TaxID=479676 RepID=A0AAV6ID75_9ERIC|nr:hypothetical protein RHGRI_031315 [Rhododendron griersonianum]
MPLPLALNTCPIIHLFQQTPYYFLFFKKTLKELTQPIGNNTCCLLHPHRILPFRNSDAFPKRQKPDTPHSNSCISQKTYSPVVVFSMNRVLFKHTTVASLTTLPDHLKSLTNVLLPLNCATVECSLELASRFSSVLISRLNSGEEIASHPADWFRN